MVGTQVDMREKQKCLRCNHEWQPRQEEIVQCPKCKSAYWNVPRKEVNDATNKKR